MTSPHDFCDYLAIEVVAAEAGVGRDIVLRWVEEDGLATYGYAGSPSIYVKRSDLLWKLAAYRRGRLSVDQIATEAGIGRATAWRWVEQDNLTTHRSQRDRRTYVDRPDLLRALAARRLGTHRPKPQGQATIDSEVLADRREAVAKARALRAERAAAEEEKPQGQLTIYSELLAARREALAKARALRAERLAAAEETSETTG